MRFTCPRCGKKYASADEPAPGRVYSLTCRCGTKITVKGPEARPPGAPAPEPSPGKGFDLFPTERRRVQGGAPVSSVDAGPLPFSPSPRGGEPTSSSSWATHTQTTRVPLKEATPSPAPGPAARAPAAPTRAAPRPAAPLDPFADMPDLQAEARGEARPLTSVPEIRGPLPEPPASPRSYDPFAAQHGLLLDEREARAIAGQVPVLEPRVESEASDNDESAVTFSEQVPVAPKRRARAVVPRVASRGPSRMVLAVAAFVVVGGGASAAWLFLGRTRSAPPTQAVARPPAAPPAPAPSRPLGSAPVPVPSPPATAAPAAAAPAAATPAPAAPARAEPPPEPRREAPRKAEPRRAPRHVAAAPQPPPRREQERREPERREPERREPERREPERREPAPPPAPPPPRKEEPPKKPVADKSVLDLLGKKQDTGPSAAPPGGALRGELTSAEVAASIRASAKAFDACVGEAARNEPNLQVVGRRVGLYITVNPSGLVTGPRLDDADLDDSVLGACLKSTARKMVFPAFQGEAFQVRIPMVLGGGK